MDEISEDRLGRVKLEPRGSVEAGSIGQWTLTYTVGDYGIDDGGTIMLVQRIASDWQVPQFDRPDQPAYTTVGTTGNARLTVQFKRKVTKVQLSRTMIPPSSIESVILGAQRNSFHNPTPKSDRQPAGRMKAHA